MKIDLHVHYAPESTLAVLDEAYEDFSKSSSPSGIQAAKRIRENRARATLNCDLDDRRALMDRDGVDIQVLSFPGVNGTSLREDRSVALTRAANDGLAAARDRFPDRFMCLATVPAELPEAAVEELDRAIKQLGMNGLMLGANIHGVPLSSPQLQPLFEKADSLGIPVMLHPGEPPGIEAAMEYDLASLVAYIFDSTLATTRMILSGMFDRYKNMKFVAPHLGGALPYIIGRVDWGFEVKPGARSVISTPPSKYLKNIYTDVVNFHVPSLRCAIETIGLDRLVLGSDYPPVRDGMARALASVRALGLSEEDEEKIFSLNAKRLLGMT
ncbi:MAG: amidohydrolase family protein [Chloroflexi bacterium]|nr:amidohydrolase family protein [Chloroflexota bacterium]